MTIRVATALLAASLCACAGRTSSADAGGERASVRIEIFPVAASADAITALEPPDAASWLVTFDGRAHPHEVVLDAVRRAVGEPLAVHSTSWRQLDRDVVLTYIAVVGADALAAPRSRRFRAVRVQHAALARGGATTAPAQIETLAVLSHAMEHLSWLIETDAAVRAALPPVWRTALVPFRPAPFMELRR